MIMLAYNSYDGERVFVGPIDSEQEANTLAEFHDLKVYDLVYLHSPEQFKTKEAPCPEE